MGALQISLLGGFQLRRDDAPVAAPPLRAARSLLAYLVLHRDRAHTRDLLIGTFWPELQESRARRRLSHALWQIKSAVADDERRFLVTGADTVRVDPAAEFWLDVDAFEWTLEQAAPDAPRERGKDVDLLTSAIALYRGDLLAGFYDDWLLTDQDRLRQRFLGAIERLTDLAMARSDYEAALLHARRLAQEDPFREEAHRRVMRIAALLGRHNDAIRQYEHCRTLLADELDTQPSAETDLLYDEIIADREAGHRAFVVSPESPLFEGDERAPFVGRERERATALERLDGILEGTGSVVLIEGESGVGKTRLLTEIADAARWRGIDVLWGRSPPTGGRPYSSIAEALGAGLSSLRARHLAQQLDPMWREQLAPLIPALADGKAHTETHLRRSDERERMHEAVALAFEATARLGPALVVLEDVHWADEDTIQVLSQLAARVPEHRLLLAVSYRHGEARERSEVWDLLRAMDRLGHCDRISLAPCSPAQTEELIRRSLGVPEIRADFSERIHRDTGGIPLFIIEMLRALYEEDALSTEGEEPAADRDRLPLTPTVYALIRNRLDGLAGRSHKTLDLVSVHDGELLLAEILDASDGAETEVLEAVDDLVRRRLLVERDGTYRIGHELMRRVVYDAQPPSLRLDLHRRVALAVERHRPGEIEVLAHHFATARIPDRAADYLERAAQRAVAVHAYDVAALHLVKAAEALDQIDAPRERRFTVAALQEEVLDTLARREEQEEALRRMERFAPPGEAADLHRRRAWWLAHADRFPEAEEQAQQSFELARGAGDGGGAVAALTALGMIACFGGRAADGVVYLERAAEFRGADRRRQADARNALGQNLIDLQRFDDAESQLLAALALYGDLGDARGQADVLGMLATLRMERGEPDAAAVDYRRAIEISRSIGWRHGEAVYQMNLGILLVIQGLLGTALTAFEESVNTYSAMGNRRGLALVLSNAAWMRHAMLGQDDRAERDTLRSLEIYAEIGDLRGEAHCQANLGSIAARRGSIESARHLLEEASAKATQVEDWWLMGQILREYAASELLAGDPLKGLAHAVEAERICTTTGMQDLAVGIKALKGRLLLALNQPREALLVTEEAVSQHGSGIELGYLVPYVHSMALNATGSTAQADEYLDLAHAELQTMLADLTEEDRKSALSNVPGHRELVNAWAARQPLRITHRMAASGTPGGRPVRAEDLVAVTWTIAAPEDDTIGDAVGRRRHRLLRLLGEADAQGGAPTVNDLADVLEASPATVRRDLAALRDGGHSIRTRGTRHR